MADSTVTLPAGENIAPLPSSLSQADILPARALLAKWSVERLCSSRPKEVVTLEAHLTVGEALAAFSTHGILSAPLISNTRSKLMGFLSATDVVTSLLKELFPWLLLSSEELSGASPSDLMPPERVAKITQPWVRELFMSRSISTVDCGVDGSFLYSALSYKNLLAAVSHDLANPAVYSGRKSSCDISPCHRLAVFDVGTAPAPHLPGLPPSPSQRHVEVTQIISQHDVIRFLWERSADLGTLPLKTVLECGWVGKRVVTVSIDTPAIVALATCVAAGVSGVGVVENGALVSSLSVSDVRCLINDPDLSSFALPVGKFLAHHYGSSVTDGEVATSGRALCGSEAFAVVDTNKHLWLVACTPDTTLLELLQTFVMQMTHRIYIVDASRHAIGVVTLTDVLRLLAIDPDDDEESWLG